MLKTIHLDWDSDFFGFPVSRIDVSIKQLGSFNSEDLKRGSFYYVFAEEALDGMAQFLFDQKVVFAKEVNDCLEDDKVFTYSGKVEPKLLQLAFDSGQFSRFKMDSDLSLKYEEMYQIWIERSVDRSIADQVFVYQIENDTLGFVTVKVQEDHGMIGLIAVDENSRGLGIGRKLINQVECYLKEQKIATLKVPTQLSNKLACKFYEGIDFEQESLTYIYHINKL